MPTTPRMSAIDPPDRAFPRISAAMLLPAALMAVLIFGLALLLRDSRKENAALRTELAELRLAHRVAATHESLAAEADRRAARLEETLALMHRSEVNPPPQDTGPDNHRAAELERVIAFLRGEITAAHDTIERLKESGAGDEKAVNANSRSPGNKPQPGL